MIVDEFDEDTFAAEYAGGDAYREQDAAIAYGVLFEIAEASR